MIDLQKHSNNCMGSFVVQLILWKTDRKIGILKAKSLELSYLT